ncbi:MAG: hypothetical protein E7208_02015 [Clostridium butyricum]|nr:hypothetical protein [Clostridium butyricum]
MLKIKAFLYDFSLIKNIKDMITDIKITSGIAIIKKKNIQFKNISLEPGESNVIGANKAAKQKIGNRRVKIKSSNTVIIFINSLSSIKLPPSFL